MTARAIVAGGLALLLCACATTAPAGAGPPASRSSADQGRFYALRSCAGCHAVTSTGVSRDSHAPAFRNLQQRVAPREFRRRLAEISIAGQGEMPPISMTPDEIRDLTAYLGTLKPDPLELPQLIQSMS